MPALGAPLWRGAARASRKKPSPARGGLRLRLDLASLLEVEVVSQACIPEGAVEAERRVLCLVVGIEKGPDQEKRVSRADTGVTKFNPDTLDATRIRELQEGLPATRWNLSGSHRVGDHWRFLGRVSYWDSWFDTEDVYVYGGEVLADLEAAYAFRNGFEVVVGGQNVFNTYPEESEVSNWAAVSASAKPYTHPEYDKESYKTTYDALLVLGRGMPDTRATFGSKEDVDPIRHLLGTAWGWGGLPQDEAYYLNVEPNLPVGAYQLTFSDVPVDAFWSVSLYDKDGFFEPNDEDAYSVNSLTGTPGAQRSSGRWRWPTFGRQWPMGLPRVR